MKYSNIEYREFQIQRRFGIELEIGESFNKRKVKKIIENLSDHDVVVTGYKMSDKNDYWHIKNDATCGSLGRNGPKGIEIASFIGNDRNDLRHIAEVSKCLYNAGCCVNHNCGLHIHAEAIDLTIEQVGTIIAYWIKLEQILFLALPLTRYQNAYCRLLCFSDGETYHKNFINKNIKWSAKSLWFLFHPLNISFFENDDRKVNLNLVNYTRAVFNQNQNRKTIELRWPEGTLDSRDIKNWTILFLSFIDSCKNKPMPKNLLKPTLNEVLTYFDFHHENKNFIILGEDFHDVKTWLLERIIFYGESHFPPDPIIDDARNILNLMWNPEKEYKLKK